MEAVAPVRSTFRRVVSVLLILEGGLLWLGFLLPFAFVVPRFQAKYEQCQTKGGLPAPTQLVLDLSHLTLRYGYLIAGVWLLLVVVFAWAAARARSRRADTLAGLFAAAPFMIWPLLMLFLVPALYLPLVPLIL
jgi:type II secretory pathway component PulF